MESSHNVKFSKLFIISRVIYKTQQVGVDAYLLCFLFSDYLFTASFNALPALKAGVLQAAIVMFSFVRGLIPTRSPRSRTSNVPKPISCTLSPFAIAFVIASRVALITASVSYLDTPVASATTDTSSFLFIDIFLLSEFIFDHCLLCASFLSKRQLYH